MRVVFAIPVLIAAHVRLLAAEPSTNAFAPGVRLTTNELSAIHVAATNNLAAFRAHVTPLNYRSMGFSNMSEVLSATNGQPVLTFTVSMRQLTNFLVGQDINSLLTPPPEPIVLVPVLVGTNVRSSTSLRLGKGATGSQWVQGDWGRPKVIRNLTSALARIPSSETSPGSIPFAVEIPIPRIWLVGYYDKQKKLVLLSTIDLRIRGKTVQRYETLPAAALQEISKVARDYDPKLPN